MFSVIKRINTEDYLFEELCSLDSVDMLSSHKDVVVSCARTDIMESDSILFDYYPSCNPEADIDMEFNTPSPSEDIWKKFELLPTPPRSPSRDAGCEEFGSFADHLTYVTELLDNDLEMHINSQFFEGPWPTVKNELLHDCMWSGQCAENCKQKAAREKHQAPETLTPTPLAAAVSATLSPAEVSSPVVLPNIDEVSETECVDPSTILSYTPLSDHSYHQANTTSNSRPEKPPVVTLIRSRGGVWKREYIVSDTPSESEDDDDDDDDDDEDEEEEEIDVVTVGNERQQNQQRVVPVKTSSSGRVITPPQKQLLTSTLNSVVKSRLICKRNRQDDHSSNRVRKGSSRFSSSRSGSDSEDFEKRKEHNSMERKRRDDLRFAFQILREMVPELKESPKAPKVLILSKAAQYVRQLTSQDLYIQRTLKGEMQKQKALRKKLRQLQRHPKHA